MDEILALTKIDFSSLFLSIFVILIGMKAMVSVGEWMISKLGLETKSIRSKREDHELLMKTSQNLSALQKQHDKDVEQSIAHDNCISEKLEHLTRIFLEKQIDDMRYEILDFASALSIGRKYSKEQFDHVINIHTKYEKILEQNNLSNGQVTASMEVINELYKEKLKNGF